jgi:hypothetical protein
MNPQLRLPVRLHAICSSRSVTENTFEAFGSPIALRGLLNASIDCANLGAIIDG